MTTAPHDLAGKQPATVTAQTTGSKHVSDLGSWVLPFALLGLPVLFVLMYLLGRFA